MSTEKSRPAELSRRDPAEQYEPYDDCDLKEITQLYDLCEEYKNDRSDEVKKAAKAVKAGIRVAVGGGGLAGTSLEPVRT